MKKIHDHILIILLMGSVWGAFELFGAEMMTALAVPHKSPFLFSFAIMVLIVSKRLSDFPGSAILIAMIALFYKSFSANFHICWATQTTAIMIDGAIFELGYQLFKRRLASGIAWRALAAMLIAFGAYAALLSFDAVFRPAVFGACGGVAGMFDYISTSGVYAAALSIPALIMGYWLGRTIAELINEQDLKILPIVARSFGFLLLTGIWVARFIF